MSSLPLTTPSGRVFKHLLKTDAQATRCDSKVDLLTMRFHGTVYLDAVLPCCFCNGVGIINNDLQHQACRHVRPLLPDLDPTRASRYDRALKTLVTAEVFLGQTQAFREEFRHRLCLLGDSTKSYSQDLHPLSSLCFVVVTRQTSSRQNSGQTHDGRLRVLCQSPPWPC